VMRRRRVLVLGLDGGTFDLLDPLFAAGELPYLRSLVQKGTRAPLRSVYPAKTIPAWYSFATGRDPGELGVYGFAEPTSEPGCSRLIESFRPAEAIWDRLSRLGWKVGVLNFPISRPYPVHGFVLPGVLSGRPETYPKGLRGDIEGILGGGAYPAELPPFREAERDAWVHAATRAVEDRARVGVSLAESQRPDFLFALFRETDRLEHQLWSELSRPVAEIPADILAFWRTLDTACRDVDRAFHASGGDGLTLVISDHGHGAIRSDFLINRWLLDQKLITFDGDPKLARRSALSRLFLGVQRLPLAGRASRRLADMLRDGRFASIARRLNHGASFEEAAHRIDWRRTVAYSYPIPEGIYLNPFNPDLTPGRRATILEEIRARLEAFPEAKIEVFSPAKLYHTPPAGPVPDLLIRIDAMETEPRMDFAYARPLVRDRPEFFYGSGTHRMNGILIAAGDGVPAGGSLPRARLLDIAPTVLEAMGLRAPHGIAGRSIAPALGLAG
jgi:predicted AlkP superfamily phosphohydrolase/phosphomutase